MTVLLNPFLKSSLFRCIILSVKSISPIPCTTGSRVPKPMTRNAIVAAEEAKEGNATFHLPISIPHRHHHHHFNYVKYILSSSAHLCLFNSSSWLMDAACTFRNQKMWYSKKSDSKKRKSKSGKAVEEDNVDDDDVEIENEVREDGDLDHTGNETEDVRKDWKDLTMNVPSLRIDAVLSTGLGVSRKKIEDAYFNAKLRHNGKKVLKKSKQVAEGDVLDLLKEEKLTSSKDGLPYMVVMRVAVMKVKGERSATDKIPVKLRRWKHLEVPRRK